MFHHYDRKQIGVLCERAGLTQRALEHYTEIADIKRVMQNAQNITPEFLVNYFMQLSVEDCLECMKLLLKNNIRPQNNNLNVVISVAIKFSDPLTPAVLINLFESFKCFDGLFSYLGSVVNFSQDPEVHFKYIESATKAGQFQEVVRICRESMSFDPERTKNFLKEARLDDPTPLLIVCDRFNFVKDLIQYMYQSNNLRAIETYTHNVNPSNTPQVVGVLLDLDCNDDYIKNNIISNPSAAFSGVSATAFAPEALIHEVESRNRLKLLLPWLELRAKEGCIDPAVHNALAKIYVDLNKDPEEFLAKNMYYDSNVVGDYCESKDPHLAFFAYKRGFCDAKLIDVTSKHCLFKQQARYVFERKDLELWAYVLRPQNDTRTNFVEELISSVISEASGKQAEEVSISVKAFISCQMPSELIALLERLIFNQSSDFASNSKLQNLLICTAIKVAKSGEANKVMPYIQRLDNFDVNDVANVAVGAEFFEEAFEIYKKFNYNGLAIDVLIENIETENGEHHALPRAREFAAIHGQAEPLVISKLARALLHRNFVKEAIDSFIQANDADHFYGVIEKSKEAGLFNDLIRFLTMCRKTHRDSIVESELIYAFAKTNRLSDLEEFIATPTSAQIQGIGDRCFQEELYEPACILFNAISNFPRLASTYIRLSRHTEAVDAAKKANSTRTWKEVCISCLDAKEFKLAQRCALNIVVHADELGELIRNYEARGHFNELISLLESGINNEHAHNGLFTELAILYCRYRPERLLDHLKSSYAQCNLARISRTCEKYQLWTELVFLQIHSDDYAQAVLTMIGHGAEAWEHNLFKDTVSKVASDDVHHKAIKFYINEHPLQINDMLAVLTKKMDHTRAVLLVKELGHLPLVRQYLLHIQSENILVVNDALNQLYIEEEDFDSLKNSIHNHDRFDNIALAKALESHDILDFRRVAASLYRNNQRWKESMELSKRDKVWEEAMLTAAAARSQELSESLLHFFLETEKRPESFASCLFVCYDYIRPDIALELAWKHKAMDAAMPYFIQVMRHYHTKVNAISERVEGSAGFGDGFTVVSSDQMGGFQGAGEPDPSAMFPSSEGFFPSFAPQPASTGGFIPADPSSFQNFSGPNVFGSFQ
eukprot:TRINITY_DN4091_c0_g1_i1.p1 TRINITY_DN4091_c0_g1~~TRINITY_DN4091_c0_g1_i1.p1  ORF type:complete len:1118 (+),score=599.66 TRINITY_DN4091_c0_g1_i1:208-3561(+)